MTAMHENTAESQHDNVKNKILQKWSRLSEIKWHLAIGYGVWHILALYFIITFSYRDHIGLLLWAMVVADLNLLGTTGGVHRLWCHRSFKAKLPLRILLAALYYSSGQLSIYRWVKLHRLHHKYTDTNADPHNSARGLFFSHIGWLVMKKHEDCVEKYKVINMDDFYQDKIIATVDRYPILMVVFFCFIAPVAIPVYFFNADLQAAIITQWFMRFLYVLHVVFSVNSYAHTVGYHSYNKWIRPAENRIVSLFTGGEGWHNYHHIFPWDYKTAEFNSVLFNRTTAWLHFFQAIGWAYDLKVATPEMVKKVVELNGDGSHPVYVVRGSDDIDIVTNKSSY